MEVNDLDREQLDKLKQIYLMEHNDSVSWGDLSLADDIVSDDFILNEYSGILFTEDDF